MKFSPIVLLLLLVFDGLEGLTLPQERPDKGPNTTLLANFSGLYVRKDPCSNKKMESSSYEASHEFRHYNRGANWTDYTNKCSTLISNFLKSICNLMKFNNKLDGTFTFHVNTSISQKNADQDNCKNKKYSLPTIVIEATNGVSSVQEKKGLTGEGLKKEVAEDAFTKQKSSQNLEKAFGELSEISQSSRYGTRREEAQTDRLFTETSEGPVENFESTQSIKQSANTNDLEQIQEGGIAPVQVPSKYVTERPGRTAINSREATMSQIDAIDRLTVESTKKPNSGFGSQIRNSKLKIKPAKPTNQEKFPVNQPRSPSNVARMESSEFVLPDSLITQQPTVPLYSFAPQLPEDNDPYIILTTASPTNTVEKQETVKEISEFSEKSETLDAGNAPQIIPNVQPVQPAESLDYLEEQAEYNTPKIADSTAGLPERFSASDRFEQEIQAALLPTERLQKPKQSDTLPYAPLASEVSSGTSSLDLRPQTNVDATQPQPKNSFGQSFEYPVSEKINQASSYSQRETHQTSSEELTELNRDSQYYTTFAPRSVNPRYGGRHKGTPSTFPVDELSGQKANVRAFGFPTQKPLTSEIDKKAGNVYGTQPGQNPSYTSQVFNSYQKTTPLPPAESLNKSNQKALVAAQNGEEVIDQFQSSKESDSTYSQISETTLDSNQHFSGRPIYGKMENIPLRKQLRSKTLLDKRNTQPLDNLPTTSLPAPTNNDERAIENAAFKAGANFSEQTKSPKSFKNRLPVPEPSRNVVSSLEEVETTESSLSQASEVKANFSPFQTSNYGNSAPTQKGRSVSESTLAPDTDENDLSTTAGTFLPGPTVSGFRNRNISSDRANNLNNSKSPTTYSGSKREMTTTSYESDTSYASAQNQQLNALSTDIYETQTTSTPRPVDLIIPVEIQSSEKSRFTSSPKTKLPDYEANYRNNFDSFTTNRPTTLPLELQSDAEIRNGTPKPTMSSANQLPVGPLPLILSPQDLLPVGAAEISEKIKPSPKSEPSYLKSTDRPTPHSLPNFQQPLRTSTKIPDRNQFPVVIQPHSRTTEQFTETTSDFSDAYSQQTSSILVPPSASQEFSTNTAGSDQQDTSLTVDSQSENASASEESYHLNENEADTFSEQREFDDIVSSQDARTQIPQPQPSFDYSDLSGQLSSNERESDTASTDLQTSETSEGSEQNVQSLLTYSPSPSVISNTETFTTETYESDEAANEYSLSPQFEPKQVASALEGTETSSAAFTQSSDQNIEDADATELLEDYSTPASDSEFIPVTPPPSLTVLEEPPFIKTNLPARVTYAVPKIYVQDISTTPRPQSVKYDQEIITIDSQPTPSPVNYSGQFLNKKKDQGFVGSSLAVTQQTEDRLERSDNEMTVSQAVVNSNRDLRNQRLLQESTSSEDVEASSTSFIQKKYDAPPLLNKGADNFSKTETNPNNFALATSTVRPVHTKTTIDEEEIITTDDSNSLVVSSTQAPPVGYSQIPSNEQFGGQRRNFPNPSFPQSSRQFHPENRPIYHPPQGFPPHHQFDNRPYGNRPQPMDFNPQVPRPWPNRFDNFAREQHNQFPPNYQRNQFESHFPGSGRFQPGLDTQRDRFMFPSQPSNHGNGYFPDGRPNFSYNPNMRPGLNPESFPPSSQFPPNFHSFQHPNAFQEKDSQYQSYQSEGRLAERNFNNPQYSQNYELHSHYPRNDFNERFGSDHQSFGPESRDGFHPDQIPYNRMNQMMPPYRGHPSGNFNQQGPHFLNNSNQQVEDMYQQHNFDYRANFMKEAKTEEAQKTNTNQASPEVLADYKKALTGLASGERLVEFDQEVITISPEKGPSSETTLAAEEHEQRQDSTSYNSRNDGRQNAGSLLNFNNTTTSGQTLERPIPPQQAQQGNPAFHPQNHPLPFSHPVDSFGPQRPPSPPNFSNQFRSSSSDFHQQSNSNFASPQKPNGGNEAASNPQQFALGPDQVFPSRKPDPASSRRSNVPSPYRNPVARPIAGPDTFSSG